MNYNRVRIILYAGLVFLLSCKQAGERTQQETTDIAAAILQTAPPTAIDDTVVVDGVIGFVVASDTYGDTIQITRDGKVARSLYEDGDYGQYINERCPEITKDHFVVYVAEEGDETGFIDRNTKGIKFQTWPRHILERVSFVVLDATNPLRAKPQEHAPLVKFNEDELYTPVEIIGEWLKVEGGDNDEPGWIKWRGGNRLLIGYSYRC